MNNNNDNYNVLLYKTKLFNALSELISRLLFKLNNNRLNEIIDLTLKYYKSDKILDKFLLNTREEFFNLFKRLFFTISEESILYKMDELLGLPILGQNGRFAQEQAQIRGIRWPEPFYFIFDDLLNSLPANFDRSSWDEPIDDLIKKIANHETYPEIRKIAILRLITIQKINGLKAEELHKFAEALISNKIENANLPKNVRLSDFKYLGFINQLQEELKIFLKNWLLKTSISYNAPDYLENINFNYIEDLDNFNYIEDLDNEEQKFDFIEYYQILIQYSELFIVKENNKNDGYLTNDDLNKILNKIIDWLGKFVNNYNASNLFYLERDTYKKYFVLILEIMNKIIYPNVDSVNSN